MNIIAPDSFTNHFVDFINGALNATITIYSCNVDGKNLKKIGKIDEADSNTINLKGVEYFTFSFNIKKTVNFPSQNGVFKVGKYIFHDKYNIKHIETAITIAYTRQVCANNAFIIGL